MGTQLPPNQDKVNNYQVLKTDYENYALEVSCQNIDESSHKEVINMLIRNSCWLHQNKDFVELQIDYLGKLGLYVDNIRFVRQEDCDDGIGRLECDSSSVTLEENNIDLVLEDIIEEFENCLQTFLDLLFNIFFNNFGDAAY